MSPLTHSRFLEVLASGELALLVRRVLLVIALHAPLPVQLFDSSVRSVQDMHAVLIRVHLTLMYNELLQR